MQSTFKIIKILSFRGKKILTFFHLLKQRSRLDKTDCLKIDRAVEKVKKRKNETGELNQTIFSNSVLNQLYLRRMLKTSQTSTNCAIFESAYVCLLLKKVID